MVTEHLAKPTLHIVLYHSDERDVKTILKLVGLRRSAESTFYEHCMDRECSLKLTE